MFLIAPGETRQEQVIGAYADKGEKQTVFTFFIKEKKVYLRDMPVTWPHPAINTKETGKVSS